MVSSPLWVFVALLCIGVYAQDCVYSNNAEYCTVYDPETLDPLYSKIKTGAIAMTEFAPDLDGHDIVIDTGAALYHNGDHKFTIASLHLIGSAHFFVDARSSIDITGNFTMATGATLSIGSDSTVTIGGSLHVFPGTALFGVVNTKRPLIAYTHGNNEFTYFTARQTSIASAPELFSQRMLCETSTGSPNLNEIFICATNSDIPNSIVIYDGLPHGWTQPNTPYEVPTPQPPIPTKTVNTTTPTPIPTPTKDVSIPSSEIHGGIDLDIYRVWPYLVLIALAIAFGVSVTAAVSCVCRRRVKKKIEEVRILSSGKNTTDDYELTPLTSNLDYSIGEDVFAHEEYEGDRQSYLMNVLQNNHPVSTGSERARNAISRSDSVSSHSSHGSHSASDSS